MDELVDAVKVFRMIRRMNILSRISGEQSESCTIRQKSTSKTWKKEGYNIFLDQKYKGDIYLYDF